MNFRKAFFFIIGTLFLLLALSVIAIDIFFLKNLRQKSEQILSHSLSAPVSVHALTIDLLHGLAVHGIVVSNRGRPCLSADEIYARYDPVALLKRNFAISDIGGRGIMVHVSEGSNDFMPYYRGLISKFSNHPGNKSSMIRLTLSKADFHDIQMIISGKTYSVERFMTYTSGGLSQFRVNERDFGGIISFQADASLSNKKWEISVDYKILDRQIGKYFASGRIVSTFTDFQVFTATNVSTGPGLSLKFLAQINTVKPSIVIPEKEGHLEYQRYPITFSGKLALDQHSDYALRLSSSEFNPRMISSNISGLVSFQADLSGSLSDKTFRINSGSLTSDDLMVGGIFSDSPHLKNLELALAGNHVKKGSFRLDYAGGSQQISFSVDDLFSRPLKADVHVSSDVLDVNLIKVLPMGKSGTWENSLPYSAVLSFECGVLKLGRQSMDDVSLSAVLTDGNLSDGKIGASYRKAGIKGTFHSEGPVISANLGIKNFNAEVFVPDLTTDLEGDLDAKFDSGSKQFWGQGMIRDRHVGYRGFELGDLKCPVTIMSNRFILENGVATFYNGTLDFSGTYDSQDKEFNLNVNGTDIDIETFINGYKGSSPLLRTFLPNDTSTVSGTASCEVSLKVLPSPDPFAAMELTAKANVKKGIVKDTLIQQQYSGVIGDAIDYFQYDDVNLSMSVKKGQLKVENLDLLSDELELHMTMDQDLKIGTRNSQRKLLISQDFVAQLNSIAQPFVTIISRQEKKWYAIRQNETKNKVSFIK